MAPQYFPVLHPALVFGFFVLFCFSLVLFCFFFLRHILEVSHSFGCMPYLPIPLHTYWGQRTTSGIFVLSCHPRSQGWNSGWQTCITNAFAYRTLSLPSWSQISCVFCVMIFICIVPLVGYEMHRYILISKYLLIDWIVFSLILESWKRI